MVFTQQRQCKHEGHKVALGPVTERIHLLRAKLWGSQRPLPSTRRVPGSADKPHSPARCGLHSPGQTSRFFYDGQLSCPTPQPAASLCGHTAAPTARGGGRRLRAGPGTALPSAMLSFTVTQHGLALQANILQQLPLG